MDWIAGWLTGMQDWAAARDVLRLDLLGKLILATILGGVIGWEREASGKAAGLRSALVPSSKPPAPPCWSSASCGRSRGSRNASRRRAGGGPCASCSPQAQAKVEEVHTMLEECGLVVRLESVVKGREGENQATFDVHGSSRAFRRARGEIVEMPDVRGVFRA